MSNRATGRISGGPIENFQGGWAIIPFVGSGEVAHNWHHAFDHAQTMGGVHVEFRVWNSSCGAQGFTSERVPPLHRGDFPKCKNCQRRSS